MVIKKLEKAECPLDVLDGGEWSGLHTLATLITGKELLLPFE